MDLETQIQSLISSFIYGMYLSLIYNLSYKYLYSKNIIIKILTNFIYMIVNVITYFTILKLINEGIVHPYFLISLLMGFLVGNKTTKKIRTKKVDKRKKSVIILADRGCEC